MIIIPAIDLIDGKCVRLKEGKFDQKKEYTGSPVDAAKIFKASGAKRIHIVDLDGAKTGSSVNRKIIKKIKKETDLIIETGGGIRKEDDIKELLDSGIDYLILGTILVENFSLVEKWTDKYKNQLIAGIDVKNNFIKTHGWEKNEKITAIPFGKKIKNIGIKTAVFTDISKDGMLKGANIEDTKNFALKTGLNVILSGGITDESDIKKVYEIQEAGIIGIIIGKAYYEGKINLENIIKKYQK